VHGLSCIAAKEMLNRRCTPCLSQTRAILNFHDFCESLNGTTAKYSVPAMAMPTLDGGTRERLGGLLSPKKGGPAILFFPLYALRNVRAIRSELITRAPIAFDWDQGVSTARSKKVLRVMGPR